MRWTIALAVLATACSTGGLGFPFGDGGSFTVDASSAPTCNDPFVACGGDVVGTWHVTAFCGSPLGSTCPGATLSFLGDATFTFTNGGAFSSELTNGGDLVTIPASCLGKNGLPANCSDLSTAQDKCALGAGEDCVCSETSSSTQESGSYSVSGTNLIVHTTTAATTPYCVQGSSLLIQTSGPDPQTIILKR